MHSLVEPVLLNDGACCSPFEREDTKVCFVDAAKAEVRVVRRNTFVILAHLVRSPDRLGKSNIGVARKIFGQEASAHQGGKPDGSKKRGDRVCIPTARQSLMLAKLRKALGSGLPTHGYST